MKIKSLLLGSAAAMVAVSGAQAADAIIAAGPEPLEYVRVCDAFGTGYFYIPGTETCLRISGYVRYDMAGGDLLGLDTDGDGDGDAWFKQARLSLRTHTATDTELGVLRTYTENRFNSRNDAGSYTNHTWALSFAYIELGGLRVGKDESVFSTWTGYAGSVMNDDIVGFGPYGVNLISYTADFGNGFSAIIAAEDDRGEGSGYMPDITAGLKYDAGNWGLAVVGGYDESLDEGAVKARLDAAFGGFSAFLMGGYSTNEGGNRFANWGGDWAVWGGVSAPVTDTINFNTQLSYDDFDNFAAVANLVFTVVPGFAVTTEVAYGDNFDVDGDDQWGGQIRFQRSF